MSDRLDGQVALVTGGGRGIGRLVGRELAEQVADAAAEIGGQAVVTDVSREKDVRRMVVNNAGVSGRQVSFEDESPGERQASAWF